MPYLFPFIVGKSGQGVLVKEYVVDAVRAVVVARQDNGADESADDGVFVVPLMLLAEFGPERGSNIYINSIRR